MDILPYDENENASLSSYVKNVFGEKHLDDDKATPYSSHTVIDKDSGAEIKLIMTIEGECIICISDDCGDSATVWFGDDSIKLALEELVDYLGVIEKYKAKKNG